MTPIARRFGGTWGGRTVCEIGTGAYALLARMCVEAGARRVYAIEGNERAYKAAARLLRRMGLEERIVLIRGLSSDVKIPERCDVLVHEIVGTIGSGEGMVLFVGHAQSDFLKKRAAFIPYACTTLFRPVAPLRPAILDRVVSFLGGGDGRVPKRGVHLVFNYPQAAFLSEPGTFERIISGEVSDMRSQKSVSFSIARPGLFSGFLCSLQLFVDKDVVLDTMTHETNWPMLYLKLATEDVLLEPDDRIDVDVHRELATYPPNYRLCTQIVRGDKVILDDVFSWEGI